MIGLALFGGNSFEWLQSSSLSSNDLVSVICIIIALLAGMKKQLLQLSQRVDLTEEGLNLDLEVYTRSLRHREPMKLELEGEEITAEQPLKQKRSWSLS